MTVPSQVAEIVRAQAQLVSSALDEEEDAHAVVDRYVYVCVCVCVCVCMDVCMYVKRQNVCMYVCMYKNHRAFVEQMMIHDGCMYVHMYACMCKCMYVCAYVCMHECKKTNVCMYVCMYVQKTQGLC